jgi:hypothetical protein
MRHWRSFQETSAEEYERETPNAASIRGERKDARAFPSRKKRTKTDKAVGKKMIPHPPHRRNRRNRRPFRNDREDGWALCVTMDNSSTDRLRLNLAALRTRVARIGKPPAREPRVIQSSPSQLDARAGKKRRNARLAPV